MRPALASRPPPPPAHAAGEVEVLIPHAYGLRRIATRCGCITRVRLGLLCVGKRVSTHLRAQIHRATPSRRRSRYVFVRLPGVGTDVRMVVHVVPLLRGVVVYLQRIYFSRQLLLGGAAGCHCGGEGQICVVVGVVLCLCSEAILPCLAGRTWCSRIGCSGTRCRCPSGSLARSSGSRGSAGHRGRPVPARHPGTGRPYRTGR